MSFTLESFSAECHRILEQDGGRTGREKVRDLVRQALKDEQFIKTYINDNTPDRNVIYEDAELGFCVCAHVNREAKEANPHDHGPSWAIYGQAFGETVMSDWEVLEQAAEGKPGRVKRGNVYTLKPGMAHIYHEGDVHSSRRDQPTGLLRIEGKNTAKLKRYPYKAI
ncbi:MAG: hypothetical protein FJ145_12280 [Deltaproteobacteria bacterium]|nr:hypothetical protein [Deltaproteobacteria bacterium]